jgi:hypothetical protein
VFDIYSPPLSSCKSENRTACQLLSKTFVVLEYFQRLCLLLEQNDNRIPQIIVDESDPITIPITNWA